MNIPFYLHNLNEDDIENVINVLKSPFLTTGKVVEEFENKFANYLGVKHVVGVTSCTAALFLSLKALGIGAGDEVITTPLSFIATANVICHAGATPVFVDVDPDTGNIDIDEIENAITTKTKAILPVHLYGQMVDMKLLRELADKYSLLIIEDAAHAIEARRQGIQPGHLGDTACFSFYATKNLTSGEGGAVATNDDDIANSLRKLRLHGMTKNALDRYSSNRYEHYDMTSLGYKFNMDNIHAALLIKQLDRLDAEWGRRRILYDYYLGSFYSPKIMIPFVDDNFQSAHHLFTIWVPPSHRDKIMWELQSKGIGTAVNFRPIHLMDWYRKMFNYKEGDFPNAELIGASTISLPFYPKLSFEEIDYVAKILTDVMR